MGTTSQLAALVLDDQQRNRLLELSRSRTAPKREIDRAQILLRFADGETISSIHRALRISRPTIYKCVEKALAAGVDKGLKDTYHRPRAPEITPESCAWVIELACQKPTAFGYAAELWSLSALARHAREHGPGTGHTCLGLAAKSTIWRILNSHALKPHRVRYYLARRDPDFESKMREVLMVYREVSMTSTKPLAGSAETVVYTLSLDEKPGVQALATTAADLPPTLGKHPSVGRDYEYVRHGTVSILAAVDLHDGHVIAEVQERHRSCEFIQLLKAVDAYYPSAAVLRLVLDNHSAHISKETMAYLATRPGRFEYVHTPKHGSWLNLVEVLFSKMARTFLRHIRVTSKDDLVDRIKTGIAEMNRHPVVLRWKNFDALNA